MESSAKRREMAAASNAEKEPARLEYRHRAQSVIQSKALEELETEVFETGLYENVNLTGGSRYSVMAAEIVYSEF